LCSDWKMHLQGMQGISSYIPMMNSHNHMKKNSCMRAWSPLPPFLTSVEFPLLRGTPPLHDERGPEEDDDDERASERRHATSVTGVQPRSQDMYWMIAQSLNQQQYKNCYLQSEGCSGQVNLFIKNCSPAVDWANGRFLVCWGCLTTTMDGQ
jgi:hypothetical protein